MLRVAATLSALALLAVACGSAAPPAATVGDTDISQSQLDDDVHAVATQQQELFDQGQAGAEDTIPDPAPREAVAAVLSRRIWVTIFEDAITERGGTLPDTTDDMAPDYVNSLVQDLAAADLGVSPEDPVDAVIDTMPPEVVPVCAAHILVGSQAEADDVVARLDDGEDFAAVAAEVSTDTGSGANGGSLGCAPPAQYVPEFRDALVGLEDGTRSAPVESQFGFHVISREGVDTSTVTTADLIGYAARDIAIDVLRGAEVDVLERLGSWDTDANPPQVVIQL